MSTASSKAKVNKKRPTSGATIVLLKSKWGGYRIKQFLIPPSLRDAKELVFTTAKGK